MRKYIHVYKDTIEKLFPQSTNIFENFRNANKRRFTICFPIKNNNDEIVVLSDRNPENCEIISVHNHTYFEECVNDTKVCVVESTNFAVLINNL